MYGKTAGIDNSAADLLSHGGHIWPYDSTKILRTFSRGPVASLAVFSACGQYRYRLCRTWDFRKRTINFVMLNPSTADERQNDPTVERCERRARDWGYGGYYITNLFALRSTDPRELRRVEDPVGPDNDVEILTAAGMAYEVICAWGNHGAYRGRSAEVAKMLSEAHQRLRALRVGKTGEPCHPLYLPYSCERIPFGVEVRQ